MDRPHDAPTHTHAGCARGFRSLRSECLPRAAAPGVAQSRNESSPVWFRRRSIAQREYPHSDKHGAAPTTSHDPVPSVLRTPRATGPATFARGGLAPDLPAPDTARDTTPAEILRSRESFA